MTALFRYRNFLTALACFFLMPPIALAQLDEPQRRPQPTFPGAEEGSFRVFAGGKQLGTETFHIVRDGADWVAEGQVTLDSSEGKLQQATKLLLTANGGLRSYSWEQSSPKKASANVTYQDGKAVIEYTIEGRTERAEYSFATPQVAILDNNVFHHFIFLLRHYDFAKAGPQQIPIFIPQDVTPGTITLADQGAETVQGKKLRHLTATTPDLEIHLWLDADRLVRITVPSANVEVVRE
jgi:hypothetical protein